VLRLGVMFHDILQHLRFDLQFLIPEVEFRLNYSHDCWS